MRQFNSLPVEARIVIERHFVLPENTSGVVVDEHNRPFERISGALVGCTVRNTNFHVHGNRQNGRS